MIEVINMKHLSKGRVQIIQWNSLTGELTIIISDKKTNKPINVNIKTPAYMKGR